MKNIYNAIKQSRTIKIKSLLEIAKIDNTTFNRFDTNKYIAKKEEIENFITAVDSYIKLYNKIKSLENTDKYKDFIEQAKSYIKITYLDDLGNDLGMLENVVKPSLEEVLKHLEPSEKIEPAKIEQNEPKIEDCKIKTLDDALQNKIEKTDVLEPNPAPKYFDLNGNKLIEKSVEPRKHRTEINLTPKPREKKVKKIISALNIQPMTEKIKKPTRNLDPKMMQKRMTEFLKNNI